MHDVLGYHSVLSAYGQWLPGDERGHWSSDWDEKLGFVRHRRLNEGNEVRRRLAMKELAAAAYLFTPSTIDVVVDVFDECRRLSDWKIAAASIESTHTHLLLTHTSRDIDQTVKWIKDQSTKAVHRLTDYQGPVWSRGKWRSYITDQQAWENAWAYIERHNVRRGDPARPYKFLCSVEELM